MSEKAVRSMQSYNSKKNFNMHVNVDSKIDANERDIRHLLKHPAFIHLPPALMTRNIHFNAKLLLDIRVMLATSFFSFHFLELVGIRELFILVES